MAFLRLPVPPKLITSPLTTALPRRPLLNMFGEALTTIPFLPGAIVIFFASFISALATFTISPRPVFAFLRIRPSILIISRPISPG